MQIFTIKLPIAGAKFLLASAGSWIWPTGEAHAAAVEELRTQTAVHCILQKSEYHEGPETDAPEVTTY